MLKLGMKLTWLKIPHWLTLSLVAVFVVRIPSLFEPFYYGDEMIYLSLGEGIRRGLILYKEIHDNKPPLLYFLAAIAGNVFWFRAILCMWMIATIVVFWHLTKTLVKNPNTVKAATLLFAFFTSLPLLEGFVANAELFMILPTLIALLLVLKGNRYRSVFLAGIFLGIASLFKIPSIFDVGAVVAVWLFALQFRKASLREFIIKTAILIGGVSALIIITFVWYYLRGAFHEYLVAAFLQNFGYVSSWRPSSTQVSFISKNGPLLIRAFLAAVGFLVLFVFRKKRSKPFLIACAWLITSLFAATLSERPYPHYFVQIIPSLSLLMGLLVTDETLEQVLVIFPLSLVFFVAVYFNFWQYSTSLYFDRLGTLVTQGQDAYFDKFSPVVSRNYEIARFVTQTTKPTDRIFVWGDSASIYALSRRVPPIKYVADYHIHDFSSEAETYAEIQATKPKLIIILDEAQPFLALQQFVETNYTQAQSPHGSSIWYNTSQ